MSTEGFIKVHRRMSSHPLFQSNKLAKHIFRELILLAAWRETTQDWRGKPIAIGRGEVMISTRRLADETGFSHQQVRTALAQMASHGMLKLNTPERNATMVISICNYGKYQDLQHTDNTPANTQPTHSQHTKERIEEVKEERKAVAVRRAPLFGSQQMELPSDLDPDLEHIRQRWNAYAKEAGKAQVRKLTKDRRDAIRQIMADNGYTIADIDEAIEMANASNYLTEEAWFSFDWLFKAGANISKVQEGKYGNGRHANGGAATSEWDRVMAELQTEGTA